MIIFLKKQVQRITTDNLAVGPVLEDIWTQVQSTKKPQDLRMLLSKFFHPIVHTIKVGFLSVYERKEKDAT